MYSRPFTVEDKYDFNYDNDEAQAALTDGISGNTRVGKGYDGRTWHGELKTVIMSEVVDAFGLKTFSVTSVPVKFSQNSRDNNISILKKP